MRISVSPRLLIFVVWTVAVGLLAAHQPCSAVESGPGEIPAWLRPGARLRLRIVGPGESRSLTARYVRHDDSTLYVATRSAEVADPLEINPDRIVRLEVSQERGSHAWTGFGLGLLGAGTAAAVALFGSGEIDGSETAGAMIFSFAFYGPLGGLVGSAVGGRIPKDRWVLIWDRTREGR